MSAWRPIQSAPLGETVIVGDALAETTAIAHWSGVWWLGGVDDDWREELDFAPRWWLPRDFPRNPFREPLPCDSGSDRNGGDPSGAPGEASQSGAEGNRPPLSTERTPHAL